MRMNEDLEQWAWSVKPVMNDLVCCKNPRSSTFFFAASSSPVHSTNFCNTFGEGIDFESTKHRAFVLFQSTKAHHGCEK